MLANVSANLSFVGAAIARALPVVIRDLAGLGAVASIAYGAWLIHPSAGFIVGGALVLSGVLLTSRPMAQA